MGYQVFAVAQDAPEINAGVMKKQNLSFPILADEGLKVSSDFGLVFKLDQKTVEVYMKYNIDLQKLYGNQEQIMPVPAIFLIGTDGKVRFNYANPDYRVRLDTNVLKAAMMAYK